MIDTTLPIFRFQAYLLRNKGKGLIPYIVITLKYKF